METVPGLKRRAILAASAVMAARRARGAPDDDDALLAQIMGGFPAMSPRVRLDMPAAFGNGYSVPLSFDVDSAMEAADYVRAVTVIAPKNPIVLVARFAFTPQSGRAAVSARVRLAAPQYVTAVAEMGDGALLMTRAYVKVETNGCA